MAYNEKLVNRVRESLMHLPNVQEKTMFSGLTFMVDEKMCVGIREEEIMCRINPETYETELEKNGVRPMIHGKRTMKGFVFVSEEVLDKKEDLDYWVNLALVYNKIAPKTKKSKKKKSTKS
ncbi:TfoX/Sxy family protein [Chondrinema litorale]|uniref:TfoX/Sxy family protein n=1 Tax=Chondrinema litorale TaxID=2994555 RepID=UPI002543CA30|nr:TfoX/Sxy family protein [Chondrinema litorale]UZR97572.1 TfoX/Sxy family protein [Chondrinema litorale]